jgi:multisubunit Na+/H+ antiporter MnhC subunit
MNKEFLLSGLVTTAVNLALHTLAYVVILKDFYRSHPAVSEEFAKQLSRPLDQLVVWAMVVTSVAMGFLITLVMKWSGAKTFVSGLRYGSIVALLFWGSVNFGLYASSNFFSQASVFVDYACSVTAMTMSGAVAAWMLGRGKENKNASSLDNGLKHMCVTKPQATPL